MQIAANVEEEMNIVPMLKLNIHCGRWRNYDVI